MARHLCVCGSMLALVASVGCAPQPSPAETPSSAGAEDAEELEEARLRIGIPSELRPDAAPSGEPPDEVSDPQPPLAPPTSAEPVDSTSVAGAAPIAPDPEATEVAGWTYLRSARRHVAHAYRGEIQGCFDAAATRASGLSGRVVIAMVPHADGRVASSRVLENGTADSALGECLTREARAWELPRPPRRTLEVQLRFTI